MIVLADPALAQNPSPQPPPSGGRPDFDRIAPPGPARGRLHPADPHMRLVELDTDVLVAGGGLAGICAAIAAARQGSRWSRTVPGWAETPRAK